MYTLPIEIGEFTVLPKDAEIDMSVLNFPTSKELQKKSSFIFIRNTEISAKFNFSGCSFEDKSEFLILFLKTNIRVRIHELIKTWIKIIAWGYTSVPVESILSDDEIDRFCRENERFVAEIRKLTASIPVVSMMHFSKGSGIQFGDDLPIDTFDEISMSNYFQLTDYETFREIVNMLDGVEAAYFPAYFGEDKSNFFDLIKRFPYLGILNILTSDDKSVLDDFIARVNKYMDSQVENAAREQKERLDRLYGEQSTDNAETKVEDQ